MEIGALNTSDYRTVLKAVGSASVDKSPAVLQAVANVYQDDSSRSAGSVQARDAVPQDRSPLPDRTAQAPQAPTPQQDVAAALATQATQPAPQAPRPQSIDLLA